MRTTEAGDPSGLISPDATGTPDEHDDHDDHDEIVVLSWWQNPVNVVGLLVATALIAGMIGWLIADAASEPDGGDVDIGFLQDMRVHHEQAVAMSFMFLDRPDVDPGLAVVARSIAFGQGIDIGRMIQLLRDMDAPEAAESDEAMAWMGMATTHDRMPGMATEADLDALGAATGADADDVFTTLMIDHHRGGLHMTEFAAASADSAEVRAMAAGMAHSQGDEIEELERLAG